jgi:MtN3 and saliva related transmembrane protein
MKFQILDDNVSTTMNVFLVIANILNLVYNIPQMIKTYQTKSTGDFSELFLLLRIVGNTIWIGYAIEIDSMLVLINNLVTVLSSIFIGFYKIKEIINKKRLETYQQLNDMENQNYYNSYKDNSYKKLYNFENNNYRLDKNVLVLKLN